jgi:hypothetical protein
VSGSIALPGRHEAAWEGGSAFRRLGCHYAYILTVIGWVSLKLSVDSAGSTISLFPV